MSKKSGLERAFTQALKRAAGLSERNDRVALLEKRLAVAKGQVAGLQEQRNQLKNDLADTQAQLRGCRVRIVELESELKSKERGSSCTG